MKVVAVENYKRNQEVRDKCKANMEYSFIDVNNIDPREGILDNVVARINMANNIGSKEVYLINTSKLKVGKVNEQGYIVHVDEVWK